MLATLPEGANVSLDHIPLIKSICEITSKWRARAKYKLNHRARGTYRNQTTSVSPPGVQFRDCRIPEMNSAG